MLKTSTIIKACLFSNVIYFQVHKSTSLGDKLFEEPCYAEHKPYELLLLSPGGTGSSSGYEYFHDHGVGYTDMNSDEDRDGLKHKNFFDLFKTMKLCNISSKLIVYQFDDPVKSILSLFRRKYASIHAKKFGTVHSQRLCAPEILQNITTYGETGEDVLGLQAHLESYLTGSYIQPIIFLRSSTRNSQAVRDWLCTKLPSYRIRVNCTYEIKKHTFSRQEYNSKIVRKLRRTYANLNNVMKRLGFISEISQGQVQSMIGMNETQVESFEV